MPRQHPRLSALISLLFLLACSATILAQNPAGVGIAAREATPVRGQKTTQRPSTSMAITSRERRSGSSLPPVVIYYPRRAVPTVPEKRPETSKKVIAGVADRVRDAEKRIASIGESITIYYRTYNTSVSPAAKKTIVEPKPEQVAGRVAKSSLSRAESSGTTTAVREVDSVTTAAAPAPSEPPPAVTAEKVVDSESFGANPSMGKPAAIEERTQVTADPKPPAAEPAETAEAPPPITAVPNQPVADAPAAIAADPKPAVAEPAAAAEPPPPITADPKTSVAIPAAVEEAPTMKARDESPTAGSELATETNENAVASVLAGGKSTEEPVAIESGVNSADNLGASSTDAITMNNSAVRLTLESRYDEASDLLRRAIQAEPDKYKIHRNLSVVYERMNKMDEALESAKTAVKLAPGEPSARVQLCHVELHSKLFDEAVSCYETLSKLTTLDSLGETSYGVALVAAGKPRVAIPILEKAAAAVPAKSITYNVLGVAYFRDNRFADAVSAFKNAVELDPDQHAQRLNLGFAHLANGNREGALSQYRLLKHADPKLAEQLYKTLFQDYVVSVDDLKKK